MAESVNFTTPVGRLVQGSLYKGNDTDAEGRPLVVKTGANAGQARKDFFFALAIPKGTEQHWAHTTWGKLIYDAGVAGFPGGQHAIPSFAWKVRDGDSTIPNKAGKRPCDQEGFKGNWVLSFSSGYAPKIFNRDGTAPIQEPDAVKLGYYVQVAANVAGNGSMQQPGIYLNHNMVALSGYGPEIVVGPSAADVGFGAAPLPAGATAVPVASALPAAVAPAAPAAPVASVAPVVPAVQPHPGFLAGPPPAPPVPPVTPVRAMTAKAAGATYEAMIGAGWTDAVLVQHGMMTA